MDVPARFFARPAILALSLRRAAGVSLPVLKFAFDPLKAENRRAEKNGALIRRGGPLAKSSS